MKRSRPVQHRRRLPSGKTITVNRGVKRRGVKRRMAWNVAKAEDGAWFVKDLTPEEYLALTGSKDLEGIHHRDSYYDSDTGRMEPLSKLSKYIKSKDVLVDIPMVGDEAYNHEGRHRALAAKKAGDKTIPVAVPIPKELREPLLKEFIKAKGLEDNPERVSTWKYRFSKGTPQNYMDRKNTAILADVISNYNLKELSKELNKLKK